MIYLDYSATTPINKVVLNTYEEASMKYIGNPNSLHRLGKEAFNAIALATDMIAKLLKVKSEEIIYTSGASEANNLAIKGICNYYKKLGKHIITSELEHSSVIGPVNYLQKAGYDVDFVKLDANGVIDLEDFKKLIREDTILVSLASVNSEIGIIQPISEIGLILKDYPNCHFHVDMTQSVGKKEIDLTNVDLASLSAQKFYGPKGVGLLVKKDGINLEPLIHGGKSTTVYRSGTPALPLILAMAKALELAMDHETDKYRDVAILSNMLKSHLAKYKKVVINSNHHCLPHILNISLPGVKADVILHAFESKDIFISTQTACALEDVPSHSVLALTNNIELATSSIRISISYLTTEEEVNSFLEAFEIIYAELFGA